MAAASLNDIYKAIGTLTAEVTSLRRDLQESEQHTAENTRRADEHRAVLHKRMDEIVDRTGMLEGDMRSIRATVKDVKEVTDKVTMWEQRGIGAIAVTGIGASAITFAITHWFNEIMTFLRHG